MNNINNFILSEIFSFISLNKQLLIIKRNKKLQKKLNFNVNNFKLFYELKKNFFLFEINEENLQFIFDFIYENNKNNINKKIIEKYFLYFLKEKKLNEIKFYPFFKNNFEFLNLNLNYYLYLNTLFLNKNFIENFSENNKNIKKLSISINLSHEKNIEIFKENLKILLNNINYEEIYINIITFKNFFSKIVAENLLFSNNIKKLSLINIDITNEDFIILLENINKNKIKSNLKYLNLSNNKLNDDVLNNLFNVIYNNFPFLEEIILHGNKFTNFKKFIDLSKNKKNIKKIDVSFNQFNFNEIDEYFLSFDESEINNFNKIIIFDNNRFDINKKLENNYKKKYFHLKKITLYEEENFNNFNNNFNNNNNNIKNKLSFLLSKKFNILNENNNKKSKNYYEIITNFLNYNVNLLDTINFSEINFNSSDFILKNYKNKDKIKSINFIYSNISNESVFILNEFNNLEELNFVKTSLNSEQLNFISNVFFLNSNIKIKLKELKIYKMNFSNKNYENFVENIKNLINLESLDLADNNIQIDNLILLLNNLSENNKKINFLDFSKNIEKSICIEKIEIFFKSLLKIVNLQTLKLNENNLTNSDLEIFNNLVIKNNELKMINDIEFSYNYFNSSYFNIFIEDIQKYRNNIEKMIFFGLNISAEEAEKIRDMFVGRIKIRVKT